MTRPARPARTLWPLSFPSLKPLGSVRRMRRERTRAAVEWFALAAIVAAVYAFVPVGA